METKHNWTLLYKAKNGHRYFRDLASSKIAVADDSGRTPEETDDGILWLDLTRPVLVMRHKNEGFDSYYCHIPLLTNDGTVSATGETLLGGAQVAKLAGMQFAINDYELNAFVDMAAHLKE